MHGVNIRWLCEGLQRGVFRIQDCHIQRVAADISTRHFTKRDTLGRALRLLGFRRHDFCDSIIPRPMASVRFHGRRQLPSLTTDPPQTPPLPPPYDSLQPMHHPRPQPGFESDVYPSFGCACSFAIRFSASSNQRNLCKPGEPQLSITSEAQKTVAATTVRQSKESRHSDKETPMPLKEEQGRASRAQAEPSRQPTRQEDCSAGTDPHAEASPKIPLHPKGATGEQRPQIQVHSWGMNSSASCGPA